ncbi:DNA glycosylase [Methylacidiphilum caldifontis]|uniref:DNA-(apurinic or apyrimidinic site) lyase n=1 Tax=Methylacidiphilum caldifontis TaxID=2795386 RepID=A0A4Y8P9Q4_9BACT|nr:DNA glycosylase [Methylacidiphilum caldifontis]TFE67415.1 3-methyladenine DNA glycosylase [Methylacidiphilum caldifontis]
MLDYSIEQISCDWSLVGEVDKQLVDIDATLGSGQTFSWQRLANGIWIGQIGEVPYALVPEKKLSIYSPLGSFCAFKKYFQIELDLKKVLSSFPPKDRILNKALHYCPRLRILKQDPWETLVSFLCSSAKPIVQIRKIISRIRAFYGREVYPGFFSFPTAEEILDRGPTGLKEAKLGFRSDFIWSVSSIIWPMKKDYFFELEKTSTENIRHILMELPGVGRKIADCVLLFGFARLDVFPIDRWMERVLKTFYHSFLNKTKITSKDLIDFSSTYFGPFAGYAQQYLFYWSRSAFWKKGGLWEYH